MEIDFKLESSELQREINTAWREVGAEIIRTVTEEFPTEARQLMLRSPATGRSYRRGGALHVASSAGNPPRVQSGSLVQTMRGRPVGELSGEITMNWYGLFLDENRNRKWIDQSVDLSLNKVMPRN